MASNDNWRLQYKEIQKKNKCSMPKKAIEKMLANPKTPEHLKKAWRKKLKEM